MKYTDGYLLIIACLLAVQYYRLARYKKQKTALYISQQNSNWRIPQRSYFSFFVRSVCIISAWVLLTICLTKLQETSSSLQKAPIAQAQKALAGELPKIDEIAFVLDLSASMGAKDTSDGEARLTKAKEIISSLIEDLGGINASLTGFAGNAQTIVPDTLDYLYFRILMDSAGVNDTGEAGTNLLTMVDAIKAKYVNSPYRKSVRIVLLTDGEDTGFLAMNDAGQKQAEKVLLDHLSATVSDTLQWEVIGLGSVAGAEVPGVIFDTKPVISTMKKELLQSMAKAGQGHFYAETDVPVTQICDDLLADVAGSSRAQAEQTPQEASSYAPRAPFEVLMLLACSALLVFASLVLPQYEKKVAI